MRVSLILGLCVAQYLLGSSLAAAQPVSPDGATLRVRHWECTAHEGRYIRCIPTSPKCEEARRAYEAFWDKHRGCARRDPPDCPPEKTFPDQGECHVRQLGPG
jgi:hypothetical protein